MEAMLEGVDDGRHDELAVWRCSGADDAKLEYELDERRCCSRRRARAQETAARAARQGATSNLWKANGSRWKAQATGLGIGWVVVRRRASSSRQQDERSPSLDWPAPMSSRKTYHRSRARQSAR